MPSESLWTVFHFVLVDLNGVIDSQNNCFTVPSLSIWRYEIIRIVKVDSIYLFVTPVNIFSGV
jgi:hypothetical protein